MELPVTEKEKKQLIIAFELQILTTKSYASNAQEETNISISPWEEKENSKDSKMAACCKTTNS